MQKKTPFYRTRNFGLLIIFITAAISLFVGIKISFDSEIIDKGNKFEVSNVVNSSISNEQSINIKNEYRDCLILNQEENLGLDPLSGNPLQIRPYNKILSCDPWDNTFEVLVTNIGREPVFYIHLVATSNLSMTNTTIDLTLIDAPSNYFIETSCGNVSRDHLKAWYNTTSGRTCTKQYINSLAPQQTIRLKITYNKIDCEIPERILFGTVIGEPIKIWISENQTYVDPGKYCEGNVQDIITSINPY